MRKLAYYFLKNFKVLEEWVKITCVIASMFLTYFNRTIFWNNSQIFFKLGVIKNFADFKGKQLCWSLFLMKLQAYTCFYRTSPVAASGFLWNSGRFSIGGRHLLDRIFCFLFHLKNGTPLLRRTINGEVCWLKKNIGYVEYFIFPHNVRVDTRSRASMKQLVLCESFNIVTWLKKQKSYCDVFTGKLVNYQWNPRSFY